VPNLSFSALFSNYGECLIENDHAALRELGPKCPASLFTMWNWWEPPFGYTNISCTILHFS